MGGSRHGRWRTAVNVMGLFTLSGLWHGADWTFVIWGVLNGLLIVPFVFLPHKKLSAHARYRDIPRCLLTFFIFALASISFRANNLVHINEICDVVLNTSWRLRPVFGQPLFYIVPFFIIEWLGRKQEFPIMRMPFPTVVRWIIYWGLLAGISIASLDRNMQFIYFQF
jgi:D-alanyl-lipoteichoic acid acyltransferase DltB (MBOAT superfamily)